MNNIMWASLVALILGFVIAPIVIKTCKKLKAGQNILEYVTLHSSKQGTPTMGGFIFIIPTVFASLLFFSGNSTLAKVCLAVMVGYAIIGFLDDFIKIKYKHNEGLKPYQKIIFQLIIATIIAVFCYKNIYIGTDIYVPFYSGTLNLGWLIIPFIIILFLATTNSVNLTDGLDGLAGSVTAVVCIALTVLISIIIAIVSYTALDYIEELQNIMLVLCVTCASLVAYLWFNVHPAKIFMGDTGSLALGGLIASVCAVTKTSLFILPIGIMYVISSLSTIIQVAYYKKTKKRVFLMAPYHHHLQMKGLNETAICNIYILITFGVSAIVLISQMLICGVL